VTVLTSSQNNKTAMHEKLLFCIKTFKLEEAVKNSRESDLNPTKAEMDQIIESYAARRESMNPENFYHRIDQRIKVLKKIRKHGCDPEKIIEKTILPEGYSGKVLVVAIMGGVIDKLVCLRSGDLWHREILNNTKNEIKASGFFETDVFELGGAHVRFEQNGDIVIFGTSDDFGSCDKVYASTLIQQVFKNRDIRVLK
jgi:hypothetical protein